MGLNCTLAGCVRHARHGGLVLLTCMLCLLAGGCAVKARPPVSGATTTAGSAMPSPHPAPDIAEGALLTSGGAPIDDATLAALAGNAGYVLIGEGHTSPCDHMVQARLIRVLANQTAPITPVVGPVIGMEMVTTDNQPVLDRFNAGSLPLADLRDALDWDRTWRHDWRGYEPIFALSREPGMPPIYALNLPSRVVRDVMRKGFAGVDAEDKASLPSQVVMPTQAQIASLQEVFAQHAAMRGPHGNATSQARGNATQSVGDGASSPPDLQRFLEVQSLWDSAMAEQAALLRKRFGVPVIILAGSGHVESGWGIAHRLATFDPEGAAFTILPWRGGPLPDPAQADAFFYCPETHASRLGFTLELRGDKAVVVGVQPGSQAEAAGVMPGDVLVTAQGMPVDSLWTLHKAGVQARDAGDALTLEVDRAGTIIPLAVSVTPE